MDNYLSKLVDRALSLAPVVEPRRASLFAPPPYSTGLLGRAAPGLFSARQADEGAGDEARQVEPNAPPSRASHETETNAPHTQSQQQHSQARLTSQRSEAQTRPAAASRRPSDEEAARESFNPSPARTVTPPPPHAHAEQAPANDLAPREPFAERDDAAAVREQTRPQPLHTTPRLDAQLAESARAAETRLATLRARLERDEAAERQFADEVTRARGQARGHVEEVMPARESRQHDSSDAREEATRRRREREELRAEEASAAARRREPATPHAPQVTFRPAPVLPRRAPDEAPTAAAPAPTIQVTIGRVEVRATNAAAPPRQPGASAAAPRLSLEEYMRRRSGGHR